MGHIDWIVLVEVDSLLVITIFNNLPRGCLQTDARYTSSATFDVVLPLAWGLFNKLTDEPRDAGIK